MKTTIKLFGFRPLVCIAVIAVIGFSMASCGGDDPPTTYTVTFNSNGGSDVESQTVTKGDQATKPTAPTITFTALNQGHFRGWFTDNGTFANPYDFDTPITAHMTLYADWGYRIGDTGLGGGKIFYRSEDGFTMTDDNTIAHYLEAAPADMSELLRWSTQSLNQEPFIEVTGTETAIGTGRKNTALIVTADPYVDYDHAALACDKYSNNGKTDWFLPSKDELNELYKSKDAIGMVIATSVNDAKYYWSSSQNNISFACGQRFSGGGQTNNSKLNTFSVRAVRAF